MDNSNILKDEKFWTIILGGIGCVALLWNFVNNPTDWANIIVNFAQIGVAVIVFIVAFTTREKTINFIQLSKEVFNQLSNKYNDFLIPPRYNRDNYDPEKGSGLQYMFITNADKNSTRRAKFIPIDPIAQGILTIYIQKGTLVYGLNYKSEDATQEEIKRIQQIIYETINNIIINKYDGFYDLINTTKDDTAIIIDFYEEKMKKRKFINAISDVSETATRTLYEMRK